jgi:signal transduction histidine kinase
MCGAVNSDGRFRRSIRMTGGMPMPGMSSPDDASGPGAAWTASGERAERDAARERRRAAFFRVLRAYRVVSAAVELVCCAAFVVGVYELVVAGGTALWPTATDDWILPMWIAAAILSGLGLKLVRSFARGLLARLWPSGATDPYAALASFAADADAAEPAESALRRLAQVAAIGTGAAAVAVWILDEGGVPQFGGQWPDDVEPPSLAPSAFPPLALGLSSSSVERVAVLSDGELLGFLALAVPARRGFAPRDLKLARDAANAAGLLVRNARLTARLADEVERQADQTAELDRSRRRVLAARDAAREQVGGQIRAKVGEPLLQCSTIVSALLGEDEDDAPDEKARGRALAEMTVLVDAAIADFRRIVHGVYPAALTDHGLAAALENLLAELPRRAALAAQDLPRLPARVEAGVYFCVAALLDALPDSGEEQPLDLSVEATPDRLAVTLLDGAKNDAAATDDAVQSLLHDRIEALEGDLRIVWTPDGLRYELEVPVPAAEEAAA